MATYEFKGGTGTSSRCIDVNGRAYTVGVLVQSNFGKRSEFSVLGVPVGLHLTENRGLVEERFARAGLDCRNHRHRYPADPRCS